MKYTIKDLSDESSSENVCSLEVHFAINIILVDRYDKDVMISLDSVNKYEIELIKNWFIEQTQHIRDIHDIKNFTINYIRNMKFSMSFSFSSKKQITFSFLKSLLEEFAEPDIHRINFLEIRGMVVFPFAYVVDSV